METTRPTKVITTTHGIKATIKTYITGREMNELQDFFIENAEVKDVVKNADGSAKASFSGMATNKIREAQYRAIKLMVTSVSIPIGGGQEEVFTEPDAILEAVLDLQSEDFEQINEAIENKVDPKKETKV